MTISNRRVHFVPEGNQIFEIETHKDFTKEEILAYWYGVSKLNDMVEKRRNQALEWEADRTSNVYLRGLEPLTEMGGTVSETLVERCLYAVLDEQEAQWARGEDDCERLAVLSRRISKFSVGLAFLRAEEDEAEAQNIYGSMQEQWIKKQTKRPSGGSASKLPTTMDDDTSVSSDTSICSDISISSDASISSDTSFCSDLSHPEIDSIQSTETSCETISNDTGCGQEHRIPSTEKKNKKKGRKSLGSKRFKGRIFKQTFSPAARIASSNH